jgi:hypothetical protein
MLFKADLNISFKTYFTIESAVTVSALSTTVVSESDSCSLTNPNTSVSLVTNHPQASQPVAELSLITRSNILREPLCTYVNLLHDRIRNN